MKSIYEQRDIFLAQGTPEEFADAQLVGRYHGQLDLLIGYVRSAKVSNAREELIRLKYIVEKFD